MPFWPFKNRVKTRTSGDIIADYGALLEEYSGFVLDVSSLPLPKTDMKDLIKRLYRISQFQDQKEILEVGYILLSGFQYGVGKDPIPLNFTATGNLENDAASIGNISRWLTLQQAENAILSDEWDRFKAGIR